ncbi:ATP-binding cassette domain-containing protein [Exiguobacterium undae]
MLAIEVNDLHKRYAVNDVLKGIQLHVTQGEIFGFLGRNGAGKSTFIHILTGITQPTSGSFSILGETHHQMERIKQKIGVMPDTSNLYQHMKALDFLKYMAALKGDTRSTAELSQLLEQVGLPHVEKQKIKSFSFGMKKKISIAQALLGNPELIFLDEPTSGLDPESAILIQQLILTLKKQGKTIFLTSHNLTEIEKICDTVAIMTDGMIAKVGTVAQLKHAAKETIHVHLRTNPSLDAMRLHECGITDVQFIKHDQAVSVIEVNEEEVIPLLIEQLTAQRVKIYEVKIEVTSLEDVFMAV